MVNSALVDRFAARASEAGAEVKRFGTLADAQKFLPGFMKDNSWAKAAAAPDARPLLPPGLSFSLVAPAEVSGYAAAEVGLVTADYGVAATGTLVHCDQGDEDRIVWTVPPACLCFLREKDIVAELEDVADRLAIHLRPGASPGFAQVSLVTGPSRTSDIEAELTLGVHGPGRLVIALIGA